MNRETQLKIRYEKQLDRLIKDRRELYSLVGEESYSSPMYRACYQSIKAKTRAINIIMGKWREVNGRFNGD